MCTYKNVSRSVSAVIWRIFLFLHIEFSYDFCRILCACMRSQWLLAERRCRICLSYNLFVCTQWQRLTVKRWQRFVLLNSVWQFTAAWLVNHLVHLMTSFPTTTFGKPFSSTIEVSSQMQITVMSYTTMVLTERICRNYIQWLEWPVAGTWRRYIVKKLIYATSDFLGQYNVYIYVNNISILDIT